MNTGFKPLGVLEKTITCLVLVLLLTIAWLNWQVAILALIVTAGVYMYNHRAITQQRRTLRYQLDSMAKCVTQASNFALQNLPIAIVLIDSKGRVFWSNSVFRDWVQPENEKTQRLNEFVPSLRLDRIWGRSGFFDEKIGERYYSVIHKFIPPEDVPSWLRDKDEAESYMAFYFHDITEPEIRRQEAEAAMPVFCYLQIDNLDDVTKGLGDAEATNLWAEINNIIVDEIDKYNGFIRSYSDESYILCISQEALAVMTENNFPILNRVHSIPTSTHIPVTISMGVATQEPSMKEQAERARAGLELALGRGGDQACVYIGSNVKFYGGKTQGSEKNTRVRARVVSQAIKELMNDSSNVIIMGHEREDYDSIGGAIGVSVMARLDNKKVHIAVSDQTVAIKKLSDLFPTAPGFEDLLITPEEAEGLVDDNTLVFVVDVHRPDMVAAPKALQKAKRRVVIDHHRRSTDFIEKPLLTYLEPASSSTSELVTELIQYFAEKVEMHPLEASALYAGIVVDTKNFVVQTGSRTFDAASYLRRSGADLSIVRHLFMDSYESIVIRSQMMVNTERIDNMAFTYCPDGVKSASIVSAQVADSLISIEGIEASFAFYKLSDGGIGVSARSQGTINVQIIMEELGGGGHRTVAGAQFRDMNMTEAMGAVMETARKSVAKQKEEVKE